MRDRLRAAARWARSHPRRVRSGATLAALVLLALALGGPFVTQAFETRHLSAYADGPRDLSDFARDLALAAEGDAEPRALATSPYMLDGVREPTEHVLFVFAVERSYTQGEARAILDFVRAGGTLVLANDVGNANVLSKEFGVLFGDKTILDRVNYRNDSQFPVVTVPYEGADYRVVMNAPSFATVVDPKVEVLASSSNGTSFIDVNGNGEIDIRDQPGPFPLVMRTTYGDGRVVLIADAGLFMNEVLNLPGFDNAAFGRALASSSITGGGAALIDESRHVPPPSARAGGEALRLFVLATTTPTLRVVLGVLALAAAIGGAMLTRGTEDWSVHTFTVGEERPSPSTLAPTPERLQALTARAISERYNIPFEYLESASVDELARLTGDRELAAVAKGAERAKDARGLYRKLADEVPLQVPIKEVSS